MSLIREKRTFDSWLYDIDCSAMLATEELITSVVSVTCDQTAAQLNIAYPVANGVPVFYQDGHSAAAGKVIQVQIGGGAIPADSDALGLGIPNILCTIRARFTTNIAPDQGEATILLLLKDAILPL